MEVFLGLLLPSLTALLIRYSKTQDDQIKVLLSLLVACIVGIPLWFGLGHEYDLSKMMSFVAGLYGIGQATYQINKTTKEREQINH